MSTDDQATLNAAADIVRHYSTTMRWTPLRWLYRRRLHTAWMALGELAAPPARSHP